MRQSYAEIHHYNVILLFNSIKINTNKINLN